ncbi:MAG: helix-turn-helix domain-containing protein [Candidatus Thiodiazotropha lotti]|nr:helix-turn-helix domain-containing protein [Candidatus Thiodiazotropha lotti]
MTNTILRASRRYRYVIIDQHAIEDSRLSWAARGLLGYLLAKPDDWKVLVNDLRKRGDLGRDGIYKLLRELREAGYIQFQRFRDGQGRIRGGTYIVREISESPDPALPHTVEPGTVQPNPVNPGALITTDPNLKSTTITSPIKTKGVWNGCGESGDPVEFVSWIPRELRTPAIKKVARLDTESAQIVIDEWAGIMATGRIENSPLGYLHVLVHRIEANELQPRYADAIAQTREHERDGERPTLESTREDESESMWK